MKLKYHFAVSREVRKVVAERQRVDISLADGVNSFCKKEIWEDYTEVPHPFKIKRGEQCLIQYDAHESQGIFVTSGCSISTSAKPLAASQPLLCGIQLVSVMPSVLHLALCNAECVTFGSFFLHISSS